MYRIALLTETSRGYGRDFLNGIAQFAQERRDWLMRLLTPQDLKGLRPFAGFDGIIARVADAPTIRKLKASRLPVIDVSHQTPDPDFIGVGSDDAGIARMAAAFFLSRGFKSFAYCGFKGTVFSDTRASAFRATVAKAGFKALEFTAAEPMTDAFFFDEKIDQIRPGERLRQWTKSLPSGTAVFCANDMRAYQIVKIAAEEHIRVPQDLSVLGSDNDNLLCLFSSPPLSSIDPNAHGVGYAAARLLLAAMKKPPRRKRRPHFRVPPGELFERASTEFHPISPEWLSEALVYIDRNLSRPISLTDITALCGRSAPTVNKAFDANFHVSCPRYILKMKLDEARRLVQQGRLSGKEIAARTGFSSPQYFCNAYHAHFGEAPFHVRAGSAGACGEKSRTTVLPSDTQAGCNRRPNGRSGPSCSSGRV